MWQTLIKPVDDFLNNTTMYRLVLYCLLALTFVAFVFSFFGVLPYEPFSFLFSVLFIISVSWLANTLFSKVFQTPTNIESVYISALILALIIAPPKTLADAVFLFWAGVLAMASKYIVAFKSKHLFNPVALAVFLTAFFLKQSANWWVGTASMLPFVFVLGLLIVRKIKRADLVVSFFLSSLLVILGSTLLKGGDLILVLQKAVFHSPLLFFSFIMLTEPLTTPPTRRLQIYYGFVTGIIFAPQFHLGNWYSTPEEALLIGNLFSYLVSPKEKLILTLKEKIPIASDIYNFIFSTDKKINYKPGQYLEWTLAHENPDQRGNRRYFTIASSPTENDLIIGVKFYQPASSFKKNLLAVSGSTNIVASQLSGDFVMPDNPSQKLVFIAGGIGVTPFRSMIKYLLDTGQKRDIVLFYAVKKESDIVYKEIFENARKILGIKTVYVASDTGSVSPNWQGKTGYLTSQTISEEVPDYKERTFYLSGPRSLVDFFQKDLQELGLKKEQIKTDYFPGFA
ncbi:MAG: oxidoreductase [Patescibacteria group bacterium]|nr:oxidoreductase [Patescibacteria group bacterium]